MEPSVVEGVNGVSKKCGASLAGREGFVIPAVIFSIVLMSVLAATALLTADDEMRSSRAVRESAMAMYAAEAGLNEVWATWDDTLINNLNPGDSTDLGWKTLPNGSSYRAVVYRYDNGGGAQAVFGLIAEGRGRGALAGQQLLSYSLSTSSTVSSFCCSSAIRGGTGGNAEIEDAPGVSGFDTIPAQWGASCTNTLDDQPGMVWASNNVSYDPGTLVGDPALVVDPTINSTNLFEWGDLNFDSLVAMADITLSGNPSNIQPVVSGGSCDTSVESNWGAPEDPSSPCFDYFPIVYNSGELRMDDAVSVGQGILLVDGDVRIEDNFRFYGLMMIKGEIRFEDNGTRIYGGLIVETINRIRDGAGVRYSQCAADRAIAGSTLGGSSASTELLSSRHWGQALR